MNVLLEALEGVSDLIPNQKIQIETDVQTIVNGFPTSTISTADSYAHIQPLTPFEIRKLSDSTLDSRSVYQFWILDNLVEVLSYLNNTTACITCNGRKFSIYSKEDWSANGWIQVIGAEIKVEENEDV